MISSLEGFQRTYLETRAEKEESSEEEDEEKEDGVVEDDAEDSDAESGIEVDADDDMDGGEGQTENAKELDKRLDKENAPDVVYAVKRLIRGLGSSRDSSRLGFAVALTEARLLPKMVSMY